MRTRALNYLIELLYCCVRGKKFVGKNGTPNEQSNCGQVKQIHKQVKKWLIKSEWESRIMEEYTVEAQKMQMPIQTKCNETKFINGN